MFLISTSARTRLNGRQTDWICVHAWVRTSCAFLYILSRTLFYREILLNVHDQVEMPILPWTFSWLSSRVIVTFRALQHPAFFPLSRLLYFYFLLSVIFSYLWFLIRLRADGSFFHSQLTSLPLVPKAGIQYKFERTFPLEKPHTPGLRRMLLTFE